MVTLFLQYFTDKYFSFALLCNIIPDNIWHWCIGSWCMHWHIWYSGEGTWRSAHPLRYHGSDILFIIKTVKNTAVPNAVHPLRVIGPVTTLLCSGLFLLAILADERVKLLVCEWDHLTSLKHLSQFAKFLPTEISMSTNWRYFDQTCT